MGCDIHCYREKKVDGVWVNQQPMEPKEIWDDEKKDYVPGSSEAEDTHVSRNYPLFGLLNTGVRREWGDSFESKAGIPADSSSEIKAASDSWDSDGHSHSWLTLEEIKTKQVLLLVSEFEEARELGEYLSDFRKTIFQEDDDPVNTRVVFWFDN